MKTVKRNLFPKNNRLSFQNDINRLFAAGKSFVSYPLRIIYLPVNVKNDTESGITVLVSVPKKRIKLAVKRNRIKRLIRESYRLNMNEPSSFYKKKGVQLHVAFLYLCDDMKTYADIDKAMCKALKSLIVCSQKKPSAIN